MAKISAYDQERLKHINGVTDSIHDKTNEIHEGMVDREFPETIKTIDLLIEELNQIKKNLSNEI
jgi:hypothetical protein